jgi:putative RNA 2'-phosphotransferase
MSVETSKFLSYVLRHAPESIGLALDEQGWVALDLLIERANASGRKLDRASVLKVVAENDKKRFTVSDDGKRIRAAQGHSVRVDLNLVPTAPPEVLYHGTADRFLESILRDGLKPQSRQQVHLSNDVNTASVVGRRHGRPVVLKVEAGAMHRDGKSFYRADNGVWLTDDVPPRYLSRAS